MDEITENLIQSIPIWKGNIEIKTIDGGLTNQNFLIQENLNNSDRETFNEEEIKLDIDNDK